MKKEAEKKLMTVTANRLQAGDQLVRANWAYTLKSVTLTLKNQVIAIGKFGDNQETFKITAKKKVLIYR